MIRNKKFNFLFDAPKKCAEVKEGEELEFIQLLDLFNQDITQDYDICPEYHSTILGSGGEGVVYNNEQNPNEVIKESRLYSIANQFKTDNTIKCTDLIKHINIAMQEEKNNREFLELKDIFPLHIVQIKEIIKCTKEQLTPEIKEILIDQTIQSRLSNNFVPQIMHIMEKINGKTLLDYLKTKNIDDSQFMIIILQKLYILTYANSNGYYHNDIKLNNIMIYFNDEITHLDFNELLGINIRLEHIHLPIVKLIDFTHSYHVEREIDRNYIIDIISFLIYIDIYLEQNSNHSQRIKNIIKFIIIEIKKIIKTDYEHIDYRLIHTDIRKNYNILFSNQDIITLFSNILDEIRIHEILLKPITKSDLLLENLSLNDTTKKIFLQSNDENIKSLEHSIVELDSDKKQFLKKYLKYKKKYYKLKNNI